MTSEEALIDLERSAGKVVEKAEATLGGVGSACFVTAKDQDEAFAKARSKLHEAKIIFAMIEKFKSEHGSFS